MLGPVRSALDKTPWPDLALLAAICFALGFAGGTPYFHPDTLLDNALHTIETGGIPDYYNKPGLLVYLHAAVYFLTYILLNSLHMAGSFGDFSALQQTGYMTASPVAILMDLPGHLLTLAFSITGVLVVYLWTRSLTGRRSYALLAGALISTSLLWVANSHYLTVDVGLGSMCIGAMFVTARFSGTSAPLTKGKLCVLGVLIGLVASAKYNGAIICVPISAALLPCYRKDLRGWVTALLVMALISVLTFLATNPALVLDTREYLDTLFYEYRHSSFGHMGYDTDGFAGGYFLFTALPAGFGILPLLLSIAGAVGFVRSKAGSPEKIALLLFPLLFFAFMGSYKLTFDRFIVPLIPFLAVLATLGIYYIGRSAGAEKPGALWPKALVVVLIAACILPALLTSVTYAIILDRPDTREDLAIALKDSGLDSQDLQVSSGLYVTKSLQLSLSQASIQSLSSDKLGPMLTSTVDIIVVDSFSFDRVLYDPTNVRTDAYRPTENFTVIQINPFRTSKDAVPFSPGSVYSPYPPDMAYRERPGPFIEIYCVDDSIAEKIMDACARDGIGCEVIPGKEGYYYRMQYVNRLNTRGV